MSPGDARTATVCTPVRYRGLTPRGGPATVAVVKLLLVVCVIVTLQASRAPRWGFEFEADSCCCHKAEKCECPDHELPQHEFAPGMRACGSGGHDVTVPAPPALEMAPAAIAFVGAAAARFEPPALAAPRAAPVLDEPAAPG